MSNTAGGLDVGKMAMAGLGQVMDSMDLVKRAWSNFSLATPFTPTLNVEELDKRIAELRAVEQWLALNQNMLRNTIHGLEVQRGTLHAIGTMSKTFDDMTRPADDAVAQSLAHFAAAAAQNAAAGAPGAGAAAAPGGGFDWSPFAMPSSAFNRPHQDRAASTPAVGSGTGGSEAEGDGEADTGVADAATGPSTASDASAAPAAGGDAEQAAGPNMAAMNPLAWWEMLQENFRQIAQAATGDTAAGPASSRRSADAASAPARKARGARTGASKTGAAKSGVSKSGVSKSGVSKSGVSKSSVATAGTAKTRAAKSGAAKGGSGKTAATAGAGGVPRRRKATGSNGAP